MDATEAQEQLRYLEELRNDEQVELAAGYIAIQPAIVDESSAQVDYRIVYTSWDGLRTRDLSHINRNDFLRFMCSEPGGLTSSRHAPLGARATKGGVHGS